MEKYINNKKIRQITLRVSKENSSFVYFLLESNEGLAFYSTLNDSLKAQYRDVLISSPIEWSEQINNFLEQLKKEFDYQIIKDHVVEDINLQFEL